MNAIIQGKYSGSYQKPEYKNKTTGELQEGDYVIQLLIDTKLSNDEIKSELIHIPVEKEETLKLKDKMGQVVNIPCNIYTDNYIPLKFGKLKK